MSQVLYYTEKTPLKRVYYTGSDALLAGYALCYERDNITALSRSAGAHNGSSALAAGVALTAGYENYGRHAYVEKPSADNLSWFAGVVVEPKTGPGWIDILEPDAVERAALLYTDASCTINSTALYLKAGSYAFGSAAGGGVRVATALQTIDRSSTNGLVQAAFVAPEMRTANVFDAQSRTAVQLPTAAIWNNFPLEDMRKNPFLGSLFETDFKRGDGYPANMFADTTGLIYPGLPANGELVFLSSADNDAVECQWDCPIDIAGAGKWAFEMRCKIANITTDVACFFAGLTLAQVLVGDIEADDGATMTDGSWVGFNYDAAATTPLDIDYRLAGQVLQTHDAGAKTMAAATYFTAGLYYDGTDIQTYVDGVNLADPILGTGDMDQATFPLSAIMVPTVAVKGLNAADWTLTVDWIRVAQAPA